MHHSIPAASRNVLDIDALYSELLQFNRKRRRKGKEQTEASVTCVEELELQTGGHTAQFRTYNVQALES
eukprot:428088-Pelagomonas_calceolata.AAC.1